MSWVTRTFRFERNVNKYPENLRKHFQKNKEITNLPSFKNFFPTTLPRSQQKTNVEAGIMEGDLAYVTTGSHKGKIAEVLSYSPEYDAVSLSNISSKKLIPKIFWPEGQTSHVFDFPDYIPRNQVRVVGKDKDENGNVSYVVAEDIELRDKYYDDRFKKFMPRRFVKYHENIEFPWPEPQALEDGPLSTPENVAMERTFEFNSIAKSGIPKVALAQLRNPYSKHKKKTLSGLQVAKLNGPEMPLTIEQKIWIAKNQEKQAETKPEYKPLLDEVQEFIGKKMAEHLNKIKSPELRYHLDVLSNSVSHDFEKTLDIIEKTKSQGDSELTNSTGESSDKGSM